MQQRTCAWCHGVKSTNMMNTKCILHSKSEVINDKNCVLNIKSQLLFLLQIIYKTFPKLKKNIFLNFSQFSEFQWDNGDGDIGGDGENFLIGKCCENEMT